MAFTAAYLDLVRRAGEDVLILVDGLDEAAFARSRITRHAVRGQLQAIAGVLDALPPALRDAMPEIDWPAWRLTGATLRHAEAPDAGDAAWFAARSLVPATLTWLQVYERSQPALFRFGP